jgi:hypothetical protein
MRARPLPACAPFKCCGVLTRKLKADGRPGVLRCTRRAKYLVETPGGALLSCLRHAQTAAITGARHL